MRISSSALKCQQQSFSSQGCRLHPAGDWLQVTCDDNARELQSAPCTSGLTPALTIAAGAAHALAASFTGDRLLDESRTRSFADAGLLGALTSLLALAIFSPVFAIFLFATDITQPSAWIGYLLMPVFVATFAFLPIGWALMLVSSIVGCVLYGLASS